ncbi:MAG: hypothetical protein QM703_19320 [Gemmatales bacterium]
MNEEAYDQLARIFKPLGSRACPIYMKDERGHVILVGTGIPVDYGEHGMLITATHVLEDLRGKSIIVGGAKVLHSFPLVCSGFSSRGEGTIDVDVAAVAIPPEVVIEMMGFYHFTTATELGNVDGQDKYTLYAFVGCPHSRNKSKPFSEKRIQPYFFTTNTFCNLDGVKTAGKSEVTHFAMRFSLVKTMGRGHQYVQAAQPDGISGCGVWKVRFDPNTGAPAEPKLVGVGIEHVTKSNAFVATHIGAAAIAIKSLGEDLDAGKMKGIGLEIRPSDKELST